MITQDTLKHYVASSSSGVTEVKLLSRINTRTGIAKVFVIEAGLLDVPNNTVVSEFQLIHGVLKFFQKDFEVRFNTVESDKFFSSPEVQETLISRAETKHNSVCISGEDIDGVHRQYTFEYIGWALKRKWVAVTVHLTDDERKQWVIDNPEPVNKFKENT